MEIINVKAYHADLPIEMQVQCKLKECTPPDFVRRCVPESLVDPPEGKWTLYKFSKRLSNTETLYEQGIRNAGTLMLKLDTPTKPLVAPFTGALQRLPKPKRTAAPKPVTRRKPKAQPKAAKKVQALQQQSWEYIHLLLNCIILGCIQDKMEVPSKRPLMYNSPTKTLTNLQTFIAMIPSSILSEQDTSDILSVASQAITACAGPSPLSQDVWGQLIASLDGMSSPQPQGLKASLVQAAQMILAENSISEPSFDEWLPSEDRLLKMGIAARGNQIHQIQALYLPAKTPQEIMSRIAVFESQIQHPPQLSTHQSMLHHVPNQPIQSQIFASSPPLDPPSPPLSHHAAVHMDMPRRRNGGDRKRPMPRIAPGDSPPHLESDGLEHDLTSTGGSSPGTPPRKLRICTLDTIPEGSANMTAYILRQMESTAKTSTPSQPLASVPIGHAHVPGSARTAGLAPTMEAEDEDGDDSVLCALSGAPGGQNLWKQGRATPSPLPIPNMESLGSESSEIPWDAYTLALNGCFKDVPETSQSKQLEEHKDHCDASFDPCQFKMLEEDPPEDFFRLATVNGSKTASSINVGTPQSCGPPLTFDSMCHPQPYIK